MTLSGGGSKAVVKHWSRTQATPALSSGEAEYYALVTACAEGLGLRSVLQDMGIPSKVRVWTDSSAAKAISSRRGLGRLRHVELRYLWVQELIAEERVEVKKVGGLHNPADHLTKPKTYGEISQIISGFGGVMMEAGDRSLMSG